MNIFFKGAEIFCHSSWVNFWQEDTKKLLDDIQDKIKDNFTPSAKKVLRFFKLDLKRAKVVILGQDPYPQRNVATGRAFEVANVQNWQSTQINPSLQNIVKLLHKIVCDKKNVESIIDVRKDIQNGDFKIAPPNEIFEIWEKQGVLLLNTALTCVKGSSQKSNSHGLIWDPFTKKVIEYMSAENLDLQWFLWGNSAQKFAKYAKNNLWLCKHPRRYGQKKGSFFAECHFLKVDSIDWTGFSRCNL